MRAAVEERVRKQETELRRRLAPHVEGELLAAAEANAGGFLVGGQKQAGPNRVAGGLLAKPLAKLFKEEPLPLSVWLAVTADTVYVFRQRSERQQVEAPFARWSRASLQTVRQKKMLGNWRLVLTLPTGKRAIFNILATDEAKAEFLGAFGLSG